MTKYRGHKGDVIEVKWVDSCGPSHYWTFEEDIDRRADKITTIATVLFSDKKTLTLASSISRHAAGGVMSIPRVAITSIRKVK